MVRVAEGHNAAGSNQGDLGLAHVRHGRARGHAVKDRHGVFRGKGLALELFDKHGHGALRAGLLIEHVFADALFDQTFLGRGSQSLAP